MKLACFSALPSFLYHVLAAAFCSLELQPLFLWSMGAGETGTCLLHIDTALAAVKGSSALVVLKAPCVLGLCVYLERQLSLWLQLFQAVSTTQDSFSISYNKKHLS